MPEVVVPGRYVPMFGETEFRVERAYASAPLEEQLEALGRAVEAGKVCQVGLSNETPWGLMESCRLGGQAASHHIRFPPHAAAAQALDVPCIKPALLVAFAAAVWQGAL